MSEQDLQRIMAARIKAIRDEMERMIAYNRTPSFNGSWRGNTGPDCPNFVWSPELQRLICVA